MIRFGQCKVMLTLAMLLVWFGTPCLRSLLADQKFADVGRKTRDLDQDLIQALLDRGRFEDALELCRLRSSGIPLQSDSAARWKIRQSETLTAQQMIRGTFDEAELLEVQQPVSDLLRAYPDHPRALFLKAQLLESEKSAALYSVLRAVVSPSNENVQEFATRRLLTAMNHVTTLVDEIQESTAALASDRSAGSRGKIADLNRLGQQLQIKMVTLALVQTDLFPDGSAESIAAATKAEQVADDAMGRLPAGTMARKEVERLRIEAVFRAKQFERCDALLNELMLQSNGVVPTRLQALKVRLCIAQGQTELGRKLLNEYFGDVPEAAPQAPEMDLARLEFLLVVNQGRGVGDWLDAIQRRGGPFARRRADAVALSHLNSTGQSPSTVDPSLIAAQGQDWLRRGDPSRAGDLLAAAAAAEGDPDRAMKRVAEAAAAFLAAKRMDDAIDLLQNISLAKPDAKQSQATHLQAAILLTKQDLADPQIVKRLESILSMNLERWPDSSNSRSIRAWLGNILKSQKRYLDAASVLSGVDAGNIDQDLAKTIADSWLLVLQNTALESVPTNAESGRQASLSDRQKSTELFLATMNRLASNETMRSYFRLICALYLKRSELGNLQANGPDKLPQDPFIDSLLEFRRSGKLPSQKPPGDLLGQVERRLMKDARSDPALRKRTVAILTNWLNAAPVSMALAERCLWSDDVNRAIEVLKEVNQKSENPLQSLKASAEMLVGTANRGAQEAGIGFWDELASGLPQGSDNWHEAKLSAIDVLQQMGKKQEAYRRAQFILLTQKKMDERFLSQYQAVPKP